MEIRCRRPEVMVRAEHVRAVRSRFSRLDDYQAVEVRK